MKLGSSCIGLTSLGLLLTAGCQRQARHEPNHAEVNREARAEARAERRAEAREARGEEENVKAHQRRVEPELAERDGEQAAPEVGSGLSSRSAVRSIATARCEREQRCGNIGADEDYATTQDCESTIASEWEEELNKYECPNGIVEAELEECLSDIRSEACGNPLDTLSRLVSCNDSDICQD
jgi:hypothetical protein